MRGNFVLDRSSLRIKHWFDISIVFLTRAAGRIADE
jgi:hypothetical protein